MHRLPALLPVACVSMACVSAACLLGGCSSGPRVEFHTLVGAADPSPAAQATPPFAFRIESPVRVPAQVDQPQLVLRTPQGTVAVQEYQRWVAPVADEWRDAVADRLSRVLGAMDTSRLPAPAGLPRYSLRLELQRFDATPGQAVHQQVAWSVLQPERSEPLLGCVSRVTVPAPAEVSGVVAAQRQATQQVADQIAQALRALRAGGSPPCPTGA